MSSLRILSLNAWGGRIWDQGFPEFITREAPRVDVFCFQEVYSSEISDVARYENDVYKGNLFQEISALLQGFTGILASPMVMEGSPEYPDVTYGLACFIRSDINLVESGDVFVHGEPIALAHHSHGRNVQYLKIELDGAEVLVANFHGLWSPDKLDSDERLQQSKNVCEVLQRFDTPKVLVGDFNLEPHTESLSLLEQSGLVNLIKQHGITSTRSKHYPKPVRFADYALVSQELTVEKFEVLPDEISDHLPLYLEISC